MKLGRAITGFLLSFVFLAFFGYAVLGLQPIAEKYLKSQPDNTFLGSVSDGIQNIAPTNTTENSVKQNPTLNIDAKSAISVESNLVNTDKTLFAKNGDEKLSIASLTKLITAVIVLDNYDLSKKITVDNIADSQNPMKQDIKLGDTMPVESFLEIMLIGSSNKSAYALSELIGEQKFVDLMNQKANSLGLKNTFFDDPTGLSSEDVSTASDLVKLTEYILKNYPKISQLSQLKEFYVSGFGNVTNTDQLLGEIPDIVCSKTGFTTQAKGCLLLVINNTKNSDYLINVVLGADDRFSEMKKLISWANETCR